MEEEREFSFGYYFLYAFRHKLIVLLCLVVGVALGLVHATTYTTTNYEAYSGTMKFVLSEYAEIKFPNITVNDATSNICTQQLNQIVETASDTKVMAKVFSENKRSLYPEIGSEKGKMEKFYTDFTVKMGTYSFTVGFVYDVTTTAERELVKKVVSDYFTFSKENVIAVYPEFESDEYSAVINIGEVERNYEFENTDEVFASNEKPSIAVSALIGGVLGVAVAAIVLLVMYIVDKHIKSIKNLLPESKAEVINADEDGSVIKFISKLQVTDAKRVLISSVSNDAGFDAWTSELCESLQSSGSKVRIVCFSDSVMPAFVEKADWKTYDFEKDEECIYLYNNQTPGVLCYLSNRAEAVALLLDQKSVSEKAFLKAVDESKESKYICTVLHSVTGTYLD